MLRLTGRHSPGRADRRSPTRRPRGRFNFGCGAAVTLNFPGERDLHCMHASISPRALDSGDVSRNGFFENVLGAAGDDTIEIMTVHGVELVRGKCPANILHLTLR